MATTAIDQSGNVKASRNQHPSRARKLNNV
jgi:hypothetical protein